MINPQLDPRRMEQQNKKVKHFAVLTFFLFSILVAPSHAVVSNWVDGVAYGTNYTDLATAVSISSETNAAGSLVIGNTSTTTLSLNHKIAGFIAVTNGFDGFTITAGTNTITSGGNSVLNITGGSNLVVTGGAFIGKTGSSNGQPSIPGKDIVGNALGGFVTNSHDATFTDTQFTGASSVEGLVVLDSSIILSNATIRSGGSATALYASGTKLDIVDGSFSGAAEGNGLVAANHSVVTIQGGSYTGGVGSTAFYLQNSDATIKAGTFVGSSAIAGGGLFSELTGATTNKVRLEGGTFSSLAFFGANGSLQNFYAGTNLTVQNGIVQNGGTVVVDHQTNNALSNILIEKGTMEFSNSFTLAEDGNFILGSQNSKALFGDLNIESNAIVNIGVGQLSANHLDVRSNGTINVGWGQLDAADLSLHSTSLLKLNLNAETNGFVATQSTYFHTNSVITVNASGAGFSAGSNITVTVLSSSTSSNLFTVGSFTNIATSADFTTNNVKATVTGRSVFSGATVDNGQFLNMQFTTEALRDYWDATGDMGNLADDLDLIDFSPMMAIIDAIDNPDASEAIVEETYFTTLNTFQTALLGMEAAMGQSASRGTDFREQLKLVPSGARGPARHNNLRGWGKYYGQFYNHDKDGQNSGYDTTLQGGVLGVDMSFDDLLVGISGGAGSYSVDADNDASEDTDAAHGSIYATYGMEMGYFDAGVAYGQNSVRTKTGGPFELKGDFDAELISAYIGGGYDLIKPKSATIFTPEASIQYTSYEQDAYTEKSNNAVPRKIDSFDADSLRSTVGLNMAMISSSRLDTFGYKIDTRFHWMHEFNTDPDALKFNLVGGSNGYRIDYPELDADLFRAGFGVTLFNTARNKPQNVLLRIDFDELFGDGFNSHNISGKVVYAF